MDLRHVRLQRVAPRSSAVLGVCWALLLVACGGSTPSAAKASGGGSAAGGTGGSSSSGSSSSGSSGSTTASSGGMQEPPPHIVSACDDLPAAGTWENITPPLKPLPGQEPCAYGGAFVMSPQDPSVLYVGSCNQGIWKTTDCGSTWAHINTGKNARALDSSRQWSFLIDPIEPQTLYANTGYGAESQGAFKSTNGGVDWEQIWPPADAAMSKVVANNFVGKMALDPSDHRHLLVSFHATCAAPHSSACFVESRDGGATFRFIDLDPGFEGGEGQVVYFLEESDTWLWGSQSNGLWRTEDSGATWVAVTDKDALGHGAGQLYRAKNGVFYLPIPAGILRSADGITWDVVPNSGSVMMGLIGNGKNMYASRGYPWDPSDELYLPFWTSPEDDGLTWTKVESPMLSNGGFMQVDLDHNLLYSSNLGAGVWRVVTE